LVGEVFFSHLSAVPGSSSPPAWVAWTFCPFFSFSACLPLLSPPSFKRATTPRQSLRGHLFSSGPFLPWSSLRLFSAVSAVNSDKDQEPGRKLSTFLFFPDPFPHPLALFYLPAWRFHPWTDSATPPPVSWGALPTQVGPFFSFDLPSGWSPILSQNTLGWVSLPYAPRPFFYSGPSLFFFGGF